MGQYYRVVYSTDSENAIVTDRRVEGDDEYVMAKLMEFSWWDSVTSQAILTMLNDQPARVMVVGDYVDEFDMLQHGLNSYDPQNGAPTLSEIWKGELGRLPKPDEDIDKKITGKFFVNHDKKLFFSVDEYLQESTKKYSWSDEELVINPIILLTAIGNGKGGGDYSYHDPVNVNMVGIWAWDLVEIVDEVPEGYKEIPVVFYENYKYDY